MKKILSKLNSRPLRFVSISTLAFLLVPKVAFAAVDTIVADFIVKAVYAGVITPLKTVIQLEFWLLPIIAQYNNFIREAGVVLGWTTMRNLVNMFFIVILLIIALATILKMQNYGYRQLLKRFVIVAILVNFSRTIVGLFIDFSQVIMLTFVNVVKQLTAANLTLALGLDKLLSMSPGSASWDQVAMFVLAAVMLFIVVVVVLAIIVILVMRIVSLWILIVLSPLAFISYTFPKTEKYFNQWSEELGKNLFAGPALAFFLWLAFAIVGDANISESFGESAQDYNDGANVVSEAASPPNMINFIIGIGVLLAGVKMTQSTGVVGAAIAGGAVAGAAGFTKRLGKRAATGAVRTTGRAAGAVVKTPIKAGGRLAWQGTSGEGMVKGGLSRVFRGRLGSAMSQNGPGFVKQWGQRLEAAETNRRKRKLEYAEKGMEGVRDRQAYADSKGGKLGAAMAAKERLDSGASFTPQQARDAAEAFKFMNDQESLSKLQSRVAVSNDEGSVQANVDKNGVEDTFAKMSFDGAVTPGAAGRPAKLDQNAEAAIRVFLGQDSKAQQTAVDRMTSKNKDDFMAALAAYDPSADRGLAGRTEERQITDPATGKLRKDSVATNRMMLLANNSAEHGTAALSGATARDRDAVAEARAKTIDITSLLKMQAETSPGTTNQAFQSIARNLNAEQTRQFLSRSTDDKQKEILVKAQMGAGKNLTVLTKDTEAQKYIEDVDVAESFNVQITGTPPGSRPPATLTPAQQTKRDDIAKANLPYAKQAFSITSGGLDKTAMADFIVKKLTADQAAEIGPEDLDNIKTELLAAATAAGSKGAAMLDALRDKHGIDVT